MFNLSLIRNYIYEYYCINLKRRVHKTWRREWDKSMLELEALQDIKVADEIYTMAALIGCIEIFDIQSDNWLDYIEKVEQYFIANEITVEAKKKGTLLTVIGGEAYKLLRNLTELNKPTEKTYDQIVTILKAHLYPKTYSHCGTMEVLSAKSEHRRTINYLAELRSLSRYCNFQAFLDEAIRDKFVCGPINSSIRKRLLTEDNLTLDTAIKLAISLEFSNQENEMMNNHGSVYQSYKEKRRCFRCNDESHLANSCKYKTFVCNKL